MELKELLETELNNSDKTNYNKFFIALNEYMKGDNTSLINDINTQEEFKNYIKVFYDDWEILPHIFEILLNTGVLQNNINIKLFLGNKILNSGLICGEIQNITDIKENEFIIDILFNIVSYNTINEMNKEFNIVLKELFYYEDETDIIELIR